MTNIFRFVIIVLKHKYFVFKVGRKLGGISLWRLLTHDWTKLFTFEIFAYTRIFVEKVKTQEASDQFNVAWLHHQNVNRHHWEYWVPRISHSQSPSPETGKFKPLPMPRKYVREMVADWVAASRGYSGKYPDIQNWEWLEKNRSSLIMHDETVKFLEEAIEQLKTFDFTS